MSPRPRFQKLKSQKRDSILEIAAEEFSLKGFDGASFNRIIERAGLSKGAAYYYFDDKADLFDTVIQFGLDQFTAFIDATSDVDADPEEFWETTRAHVRTGLQLLRKQAWIVGFIRMLYSMHGSAPSSPVVKKAFDFGRLKTRSFIEAGQRRGAVRTDLPPELLTECVFGLGMGMDRWFLDHFEEVGEDDFDAWSFTFTDLMRRVLEDRKSP